MCVYYFFNVGEVMLTSVGSLDGKAKENFKTLKSALSTENFDNASVHSDEIERRILDKIEAITKKDMNLSTNVEEIILHEKSQEKQSNAVELEQTQETTESPNDINRKISTGTSPPPQSISTQVIQTVSSLFFFD